MNERFNPYDLNDVAKKNKELEMKNTKHKGEITVKGGGGWGDGMSGGAGGNGEMLVCKVGMVFEYDGKEFSSYNKIIEYQMERRKAKITEITGDIYDAETLKDLLIENTKTIKTQEQLIEKLGEALKGVIPYAESISEVSDLIMIDGDNAISAYEKWENWRDNGN